MQFDSIIVIYISSESVLFGSKHKYKSQSKLSFSCKGQPIEAEESVNI